MSYELSVFGPDEETIADTQWEAFELVNKYPDTYHGFTFYRMDFDLKSTALFSWIRKGGAWEFRIRRPLKQPQLLYTRMFEKIDVSCLDDEIPF